MELDADDRVCAHLRGALSDHAHCRRLVADRLVYVDDAHDLGHLRKVRSLKDHHVVGA
jgi:hypothetical protein